MPLRLLATVTALVALSATAVAAPRVVASIKPVHSLVAAVMQGVGTPTLLVSGAGSPHNYALRPSEARQLQSVELVVWVGPGMEAFLAKPVASLGDRARVLTLIGAPGVELLAGRSGGIWEVHDHDHHAADDHADGDHDDDHHDDDHRKDSHHDHHHDTSEVDAHIWLDPDNAMAIGRLVAASLSELDPDNAASYRRNADRLAGRIATMAAGIDADVAAVRARPYVVFHDAYQYFEHRFATAAAGAVTVSPEREPGARRLSQIRRRIVAQGIVCVFREPQFEPAIITTIADGTPARVGVLDPLGAVIPPGPDAYIVLMQRLTTSLVDCLAG